MVQITIGNVVNSIVPKCTHAPRRIFRGVKVSFVCLSELIDPGVFMSQHRITVTVALLNALHEDYLMR